MHELGHILNAKVIYMTQKKSAHVNDWENNETATKIVNSILDNTNITNKEILKGLRNKEPANMDIPDDKLLKRYSELTLAKKREIKLRSISEYAYDNDTEAIAEMFSDWYSNREKANSHSKRFMQIAKKLFE